MMGGPMTHPFSNEEELAKVEKKKFVPLADELSYRATEEPPELEVVPTTLVDSIPASALLRPPEQPKPHKNSSMYGIPTVHASMKRSITNSGKRITRQHAQYALTAGMILGIRECVGGDEALREAELEPNQVLQGKHLKREWARIRKYQFESGKHCITSHYNAQALPFGYEFKAYAPLVFARIRSAFGVENQSYLHSICGKFNFVEFMSNAKSGQFFFFSHDGQYMIKTMTSEESLFLHEILARYYKHLMDNPHSFVTHFYGMYRVKMPDQGRSIHFVIMKSVFNTEREIHKTWDLKGSTAGRRANRGDSVHKDLDLLEEGRKLRVGQSIKEQIMLQMRRDATFLARMGIMDYSLLLGVHHRVDKNGSGSSAQRTTERSASSVSNSSNSKKGHVRKKSLMRTNTPFRRHLLDGVEIDAEHAAQAKLNTDMMEAAQSEALTAESDDDSIFSFDSQREDAMSSFGEDAYSVASDTSSDAGSERQRSLQFMSLDANPITLRADLGVESHVGDDGNATREIYFFGIIDILQQYNARKWGETVIRKAAGNAEAEISCVDPETYANRFVKFMEALME